MSNFAKRCSVNSSPDKSSVETNWHPEILCDLPLPQLIMERLPVRYKIYISTSGIVGALRFTLYNWLKGMCGVLESCNVCVRIEDGTAWERDPDEDEGGGRCKDWTGSEISIHCTVLAGSAGITTEFPLKITGSQWLTISNYILQTSVVWNAG